MAAVHVTEIYTPEERRLLEAWFEGKSLSLEDEGLLAEWGFDHDACEAYTRLDAWVGAFAVRDIQERLPNCGICREDGVILTRPIEKKRRSKKVAFAVRFLFRINWANSGPGFSWPADYHLVWLPGFDRWVLTYSADSPDAMGYCDFALGAFGAEQAWRKEAWEGHEDVAEEADRAADDSEEHEQGLPPGVQLQASVSGSESRHD